MQRPPYAFIELKPQDRREKDSMSGKSLGEMGMMSTCASNYLQLSCDYAPDWWVLPMNPIRL